ncbi:hypothetical protein [Paraflavitalea pollutisoli]|uniref:hypothetical protein n=1 Tax=Paraflavitalea pollutisoli TaxID=3034143 RepID=UPI0023EC096C|nr:hypothetical protein [Paraflavitalea sp. H1-2-19X]
MKRHVTLYSLVAMLVLLVAISGCDKETDQSTFETPDQYIPLQVGKYIRYQVDSLIWLNVGDNYAIRSYQAKDVVEGTGTDLLGRPSWRVQRYMRSLKSTNEAEWAPAFNYEVVRAGNNIELVENNLRFVKMQTPLVEGRGFMGNGYLPSSLYYDQFKLTITGNIGKWESTYEEFGAAEINGKNYDSTITVTMVNDSIEVPIIDRSRSASKTVWVEKYAKGIGLIYRDVALWEYNPPSLGNAASYAGFGIRLTILDHN